MKKGSFAASVGVTYGIWSVGRKVFSSENAGLSPRDRGAGAKNSLRAQRDFFIWQHFFGADRAEKIWKRRLLDEIASSPNRGSFPFRLLPQRVRKFIEQTSFPDFWGKRLLYTGERAHES